MEYGVHLPQIAIDGQGWTMDGLLEYVRVAERLGFSHLCANDHLFFSRPWLDGPTALAALLSHTEMGLATTISLPVVRGPAPLAKTLGAIDLLSEGRLVVGVGPGSSEEDYEAVGIPFEQRWRRFEESIETIRALWNRDRTFDGDFYSSGGRTVDPLPAQPEGPPIWIGSWGSKAGLRRVARLGDGWLASGYNTTPSQFGEARAHLETELLDAKKDPGQFPIGLATVFFHVTEDEAEAERVVRDTLGPLLGRQAEELAERLPIGPPRRCARTLASYRSAGLERVYVWPVADELEQLRNLSEQVVPLVEGSEFGTAH